MYFLVSGVHLHLTGVDQEVLAPAIQQASYIWTLNFNEESS